MSTVAHSSQLISGLGLEAHPEGGEKPLVQWDVGVKTDQEGFAGYYKLTDLQENQIASPFAGESRL